VQDAPNEREGVPPTDPGRRSSRLGPGETILQARVTLAQRQKFAQLGGTQWLCRMIDAAPHLPKVFTGEERIMAMLMHIPDPMRQRRPPQAGRN